MEIDTKREVCYDTFTLPFYDCDYKKRIKISTILKITAQIAGKDYTDRGVGHEFLWDRGYVFLLSRISFHIRRYLNEPEELKVSTWECGKKGAMFLRGYYVESNGEICIDGESGWIVVNPVTRKIIRPSAFPWMMPQLDNRPVTALPIDKITCENGQHLGSHKVVFSDLDANGHVYNANYGDIALNLLPREEFERDIENFKINFVNEAVLGDEIDIFASMQDRETRILGKIEDKICFEVEILYKN